MSGSDAVNSFSVTSDQADRRLDRVLRGLFGDVPLGTIMKAVRTGAVRVNGARKDIAYRLEIGDTVAVPWALEPVQAVHVQVKHTGTTALRTVFKNECLWCVDKPAGLLSQPDKSSSDSVITRAWSELAWSRSDFKPALIQRLDRNVSGVMAIAMDAPTLRALSSLMRDGMIKKIYRAVVSGEPPASGEIDLPLAKDEQNNSVYVDRISGKPSLTRFVTLQTDGAVSLVELELVTGRPHQARVHLAAIGHPILGDFKYFKNIRMKSRDKDDRLFLHALSITLPDDDTLPSDIKAKTFTAPMPRQFSDYFRI